MFSCNQEHKSTYEESETKGFNISQEERNNEDFDWLTGKWKRFDEEKEIITVESWSKISSTEYTGIVFAIQRGDTTIQEKFRLKKENEKWFLKLEVPEEYSSITFPLCDLKNDEFICENDSKGFLKRIRYYKKSNKLYTFVSGESEKIRVSYERFEPTRNY